MGFWNWIFVILGITPPDGRLKPAAGDGEVIPNGSMHWRAAPGGRGLEWEQSNDFDTKKIGMNTEDKPFLVPGHLHVRLRYPSAEAAAAARERMQIVQEGDDAFCLGINVQAIARHTSTENLPADVRVDW
jgi:hypothetical protein